MNTNVTLVFVRNLELLARIGVHGHEHGKPQPVRINVWLTCKVGSEGDKLDGVVDWQACLEDEDEMNREVTATHIGIRANFSPNSSSPIVGMLLTTWPTSSGRSTTNMMVMIVDRGTSRGASTGDGSI